MDNEPKEDWKSAAAIALRAAECSYTTLCHELDAAVESLEAINDATDAERRRLFAALL